MSLSPLLIEKKEELIFKYMCQNVPLLPLRSELVKKNMPAAKRARKERELEHLAHGVLDARSRIRVPLV